MIKSLKIILPQSSTIQNKLKNKLSEYEKRVSKLKKIYINNPDLSYNSIPGIKALITKRLYQRGEVETKAIAKEITEEYGKLDHEEFNVAASVINDYCNTGGENTKKGTGF